MNHDDPQEQIEQQHDSADEQYTAADELPADGEEQKKTISRSTLLVIGIIAVAATAMALMYVRSGPRSADAASMDATGAVAGFLDKGDESIRDMEKMLEDTERVVEQFLNYPSVNQVPVEDLRTNPFRHEDGTATAAQPTDRAREAERAAVLRAVQGLQVQSIMHGGARAACMINNNLYLEGQEVDGFLIERIQPGSVIVRQGSYRVELRMSR